MDNEIGIGVPGIYLSRVDASLRCQVIYNLTKRLVLVNLDMKAGGDVSIEGNNVSIKGAANTSLEGGSATTVKGMSVKIAGKIDFSAA